VTEEQWLACKDPRPMLGHLGRVSPRKLRLLTCACCRRAWDLLTDERSRRAVEVAESFAGGLADVGELRRAQRGAQAACRLARQRHGPSAFRLFVAACLTASAAARRPRFDPVTEFVRGAKDRKDKTERTARAALCRDLFGNPFRPASASAAWGVPQVVALAQAAYEERLLPAGTLDPTRLAVLADALEEAGCDQADLLAHLRGPGPHVRGCWAVDLLLGKG
jgi:hypothetical protein